MTPSTYHVLLFALVGSPVTPPIPDCVESITDSRNRTRTVTSAYRREKTMAPRSARSRASAP